MYVPALCFGASARQNAHEQLFLVYFRHAPAIEPQSPQAVPLIPTYLPEGVSFVVVEASFHTHDGNATQQAEHHFTIVTDHCGHWEVGDVLVRKRFRFFQLVGQAT